MLPEEEHTSEAKEQEPRVARKPSMPSIREGDRANALLPTSSLGGFTTTQPAGSSGTEKGCGETVATLTLRRPGGEGVNIAVSLGSDGVSEAASIALIERRATGRMLKDERNAAPRENSHQQQYTIFCGGLIATIHR